MKINLYKINKLKRNSEKGFALLFTVVIVGAIAVITAGLTSTIYKQLILSSLSKDSNSAFYEADTGADCALYADLRGVAPIGSTFLADHVGNSWFCGGIELRVKDWNDTNPMGNYKLEPVTPDDFSEPCFNIEVTRTNHINEKGKTVTDTLIKTKGYNICDTTNIRAVEREIDIEYSG
jgi:Tfp pilus assembly protein PilE